MMDLICLVICSTFGLVWFSLVLWHINYCKLFNAKTIFLNIKSSISNKSAQCKYTVHWIVSLTLDPYLIVLSVKQEGIKYYFLVFCMTVSENEPRCPGPLANTQTIMPLVYTYICNYLYMYLCVTSFTTYWIRHGYFSVENSWFLFSVFLVLDRMPSQGWRTQSILIFSYNFI